MLPIDDFKETLAKELQNNDPRTVPNPKQSNSKDEGYEPPGISENENRLRTIESLIEESFEKYKEKNEVCTKYGIDELEFLAIYILESEYCRFIQEAAYYPQLENPISSMLIKALDSAVIKSPQTTHSILFRQENYDNEVYKVGREFCKKGFFTTSRDNFENSDFVWHITPLKTEFTKAHEIYKILNHGSNCDKPEYQVEFERNSWFKVTKIEEIGGKKKIHIEEIDK